MRHYVRKTSKDMTPDTDIRIALQEIIVNRKSLNSVSERFNIPKTTLHRYLNKVGGGDIENLHTGYSKHLQIFSYEQENSIENYIKFAADIYYGLTPHDIKTLAYECAVSYDIKIPDSWHRNKMAGQDWFSGFMQRHKLLSARVPEATSLSRSTSFNKTNVAAFYEKLAEVIDRYKIKGHQIYNVDETGITTVQKPRSIIATKGTKQVGDMTSGERGTLVTTCLAISATGYMVPPILIFPRKNFKTRDGPTGCIGAANSSGWMIGEHFLEFLMHFREHTRPSPLNPVILLLDNHNSHVHLQQCTYECKEINKRSVGKAVVKFCGNEGSDDDEKQAILRRLLQAVITYFGKGDAKPKVWSNVEVRIYVDIDVVFIIRAGEGYYQFIALLDHLDQPQVEKTTPSRHGQLNRREKTSEQQNDGSLSRQSVSYFQAFKDKLFGQR